jgi:hypothetical protein
MWGGRAWHVPRIVIQETVQGISVKRVVRVRVERRPATARVAQCNQYRIVVTYGYRDTTAPHAAILQRPRYFRLVGALFRAPPPAGRSRRFDERRPNGQATLTVEPERLGLAQTVVCRGLRVSGERSGGRKPRAGAGAARRRGASPQPARPPARQPLARTRPPAPGRHRPPDPPSRTSVRAALSFAP